MNRYTCPSLHIVAPSVHIPHVVQDLTWLKQHYYLDHVRHILTGQRERERETQIGRKEERRDCVWRGERHVIHADGRLMQNIYLQGTSISVMASEEHEYGKQDGERNPNREGETG